jgi:hypothetical protein
MGIRLILSELFLLKRIWCTVHLPYFDLHEIILRRKQRSYQHVDEEDGHSGYVP